MLNLSPRTYTQIYTPTVVQGGGINLVVTIATDCRQTLPICVSRINEQLLTTTDYLGGQLLKGRGGIPPRTSEG